ncbi:low temperature requirement protein A, partial [Klebsiella pneumoniae]|uniref:low temperature requirement protein A n=1 Tax=Klebsiella pneumoniae TaxID=573 RepID=UPI00298E4A72
AATDPDNKMRLPALVGRLNHKFANGSMLSGRSFVAEKRTNNDSEWAWMNFSWFASAYDNDDALYRCLTFVQIVGSLVMAAGIPDVFHSQDFDIIIVGYVIMRLALVTQWLRAAKHDP